MHIYSGETKQERVKSGVSVAIHKEYKRGMNSVYSDFFKSFDNVNHDLLFHKLEVYGIEGFALQWLVSLGMILMCN